MRGRKPKPTALKVIQGNPGKRPLPKNEPKPATTKRTPPAPVYLPDDAKAEWRRVAKELHGMGLLTRVDTDALAAYCQVFARWVEAERKLATDGMVTITSNGNPIQNPWLSIANRAMTEMRKWLIEFGMTPSSRARVKVASTEEADPFAEFMNRRQKRERRTK